MVKAGASAEIALSDYRIHSGTDDAWGAVTADLSTPRTVLDLDDVKALKPGEALSMEAGGTISAAVTLSWSDVLASSLPAVLSELPAALGVTVTLRSGLTTTAAVRVTDQFVVVISRTRDGHTRFAIRKAAARSRSYGIDVSAGVEVSGMPVVDEVLDTIASAILAKAPETAVEPLRKRLREKLQDAVRWKAATGFEYEYARIDERTAIADFILRDDSQMAGDHAAVVSGDFARVFDLLRHDPDARTVVRYVNESTVTRRSSFGFSLGLGRWALTTKDSSVFRMSTRNSLEGFKLMTAQGTRRYDEKNVPQNDFEWVVDLKAQMSEFIAQPTSRDFDYGLHVVVSIERGAIAEGDLERMLDLASMWDVCVPPLADFKDAVGRKGTIRVQMLLERSALALAISRDASPGSWADPLAMAMPYASTFPERRTHTARRETYAHAWKSWLLGDPVPALPVQSGLAVVEKQEGPGSFAWVSGEGHPHLRASLAAFARGSRQLRDLMAAPRSPDGIGDAYAFLEAMWSQRLYVAALGRWLLDGAGATARCTLQVEYADTTLTV